MVLADRKKARKRSAQKDIADQLIEAAFSRIGEHGWRRLTLYELSQDTGFSIDEIHDVFPTKALLLKGYVQRVDRHVLDAFVAEETDSPRDQIFDLMMRRFDEFNEHKAALHIIANQACVDPDTLCVGGCGLLCSMRKVLTSAGVRVSGIHGMLRVKALSAIFLATFRTWLGDTSEDMSKTMAELDKRLARAEAIEQGFCRARNRATA